MFRACLLGLLAGVVLTSASACGSNSTTAPTVEPPSTVEVWSGTLALGAAKFYSFSVPLGGTVSIVVKSLTQDGAATAEFVTVGVGQPRSTDCSVGNGTIANASDTVLLSAIQATGIYCVRIWDNAQLTKPVAFSVNINHPKQ